MFPTRGGSSGGAERPKIHGKLPHKNPPNPSGLTKPPPRGAAPFVFPGKTNIPSLKELKHPRISISTAGNRAKPRDNPGRDLRRDWVQTCSGAHQNPLWGLLGFFFFKIPGVLGNKEEKQLKSRELGAREGAASGMKEWESKWILGNPRGGKLPAASQRPAGAGHAQESGRTPRVRPLDAPQNPGWVLPLPKPQESHRGKGIPPGKTAPNSTRGIRGPSQIPPGK